MTHWSEIVKLILQSRSRDLKELAKIAGVADPSFYSYQSLAGCDLRGQDLSGLDFTESEIEKSILDNETIIDSLFDVREIDINGYFVLQIPKILNEAIKNFSEYYGYVYKAWSYKKLFSRFMRSWQSKKFNNVIEQIESNKTFLNVCLKNYTGDIETVRILLDYRQVYSLRNFEKKYPQYDPGCFALLSGLILARTPYSQLGFGTELPFENFWLGER